MGTRRYRWNYWAFALEMGCSLTGLAFASVNSVLPAFAGQLTSSQPLIGLTSTIFYGGWYLPQLFVGRLIAGRARQKPTMIASLSGRAAFWVLGLALWLRPGMRPNGALGLFYACLTAWILTDAVASLTVADVMARSVPLERRGSMMGLGQFLGGLGGIGAGALVGTIVASPGLAFPTNYALLFILTGVWFVPATILLVSVRERPAVIEGGADEGQAEGHWMRVISSDRGFRRYTACRVLYGIGSMAAPFYVGHAQRVLGLPEASIGTMVMAQVLATTAVSLGMGFISDRWGPRRVITIGTGAAVAAPLLALGLHLSGRPELAWAYPVVFVALGVAGSAVWSGFFNYLISSAPDGIRTTYVGLGNTIAGLVTLAPVVGGWLLEASSYTVLFAVTAAVVSAGFVLSFRLRRIAPEKPL
jgi:MFS family permease